MFPIVAILVIIGLPIVGFGLWYLITAARGQTIEFNDKQLTPKGTAYAGLIVLAVGLIPWGIGAFLARNRTEWKTIYVTEYDRSSERPPSTTSGEDWDDYIVDQDGIRYRVSRLESGGFEEGQAYRCFVRSYLVGQRTLSRCDPAPT